MAWPSNWSTEKAYNVIVLGGNPDDPVDEKKVAAIMVKAGAFPKPQSESGKPSSAPLPKRNLSLLSGAEYTHRYSIHRRPSPCTRYGLRSRDGCDDSHLAMTSKIGDSKPDKGYWEDFASVMDFSKEKESKGAVEESCGRSSALDLHESKDSIIKFMKYETDEAVQESCRLINDLDLHGDESIDSIRKNMKYETDEGISPGVSCNLSDSEDEITNTEIKDCVKIEYKDPVLDLDMEGLKLSSVASSSLYERVTLGSFEGPGTVASSTRPKNVD